MFNINTSDLAYEKVMKALKEADEAAPDPNNPMDLNNNMGDPSNDSVNAAQSGLTPQQAYEMALKAMDEKIETTGRKRFQKYRMDGGKKTYSEFKKEMEEKALEQIDKEMKQEFGFIPGQETEKDLLFQIRDLLQGLKQNNDEEQEVYGMQLTGQLPDMSGGQQPPMDQSQPPMDQQAPMDQGQQPPMEAPPADQGEQAPPQEGQPMDQGQQPMQESFYFRPQGKQRKRLFNLYN